MTQTDSAYINVYASDILSNSFPSNDENFKFQDVHVCVELTICIAFDNIFQVIKSTF